MIELAQARKLIGKVISVKIFGESPISHIVSDIAQIHRSMNSPFNINGITFETEDSQERIFISMVGINQLLKHGISTNIDKDIEYKIENERN